MDETARANMQLSKLFDGFDCTKVSETLDISIFPSLNNCCMTCVSFWAQGTSLLKIFHNNSSGYHKDIMWITLQKRNKTPGSATSVGSQQQVSIMWMQLLNKKHPDLAILQSQLNVWHSLGKIKKNKKLFKNYYFLFALRHVRSLHVEREQAFRQITGRFNRVLKCFSEILWSKYCEIFTGLRTRPGCVIWAALIMLIFEER